MSLAPLFCCMEQQRAYIRVPAQRSIQSRLYYLCALAGGFACEAGKALQLCCMQQQHDLIYQCPARGRGTVCSSPRPSAVVEALCCCSWPVRDCCTDQPSVENECVPARVGRYNDWVNLTLQGSFEFPAIDTTRQHRLACARVVCGVPCLVQVWAPPHVIAA